MDGSQSVLAAAISAELRSIGLVRELAELVSQAGRHSRGRIVLALGRESVHDAMPCAVATELIHRVSVIRDDIEDGDTKRRGRSTIHVHVGVPSALALSDLLLSRAFAILRSLGSSFLDQAIECYSQMSLGQCIDLSTIVDSELIGIDYPARLKTGSLVSLSFRFGAAVGRRPSAEVDMLSAIGMHLGTAFQLRNDVRNFTIDEGRETAPGEDLRRGRTTSIAIALRHAIGRSSEPESAQLEAAIKDVEYLIDAHSAAAAQLGRTISVPASLWTLVTHADLATRFVGDQSVDFDTSVLG